MSSPRFHPFVRLALCVLGALLVMAMVTATMSGAVVVAATLAGRRAQATQLLQAWLHDFALVLTLLSYPFLVLWLWVCRHYFDKRSFVSLGLRPHRAWRDFTVGAATGALAIALLTGVLWLCGALRFDNLSNDTFDARISTDISMLCLWALAFGAVGFMEELLFRGYALHNLHAWLGKWPAIVLQALVFALIHLGNAGWTDGDNATALTDAWRAMPNIFLVGVFFALCFWKTGSLWFPIGFHAAWNFFLGCIFSLPVSGLNVWKLFQVTVEGNPNLTGGSFGAEGSLVLTPLLLALIWMASRAPDHPQAALDLGLLAVAKEQAVPEPETQDATPAPSIAPRLKERVQSIHNDATPLDLSGISLESAHRTTPVAPAVEAAPVLVVEKPAETIAPAIASAPARATMPQPVAAIPVATPSVPPAASPGAPASTPPAAPKPPAPRW